MKRLSVLLGVVCLLGWMALAARAGEISVKVVDKEPPKEIGESIRAALDPKAIQLLEGETPIFEFWFRREIPLQSKPESASASLKVVEEITLVGVVAVGKGQRDYKDSEIIPGAYTIRFGLQPQDGDHLGTSDFPFFAVLIPAKNDAELDGIKKYRAMVKASAKATTGGHPAVLSLRPPSGKTVEAPTLTTPAPDHKAIQLHLPGKTADSGEGNLDFELVFEGKFKS